MLQVQLYIYCLYICFIYLNHIITARGLDIPHIRTVVNFEVARDIDTHTHRVGRTGRAGLLHILNFLVLGNISCEFHRNKRKCFYLVDKCR